MLKDNIGFKLDVNDYLTNSTSTNHTIKRKHKMAGGIASSLMHYAGLGMLGGVFISSITSGINAKKDVKKNCDKIKEIGDKINSIDDFRNNELRRHKFLSQAISSFNDKLTSDIGDTTKLLDEEIVRYKSSYKMAQIINGVVVGSFILLIISKIIVVRYNL